MQRSQAIYADACLLFDKANVFRDMAKGYVVYTFQT
jgi:hypothetical protein